MTECASAASSASLLRRPGCWITVLIVIPLLIGGLYATENWLGARQLARTKSRLAADGLHLDPAKLPTTRSPDAKNFFATPLLAAIFSGTATGPGIDSVRRIDKWQYAGHKGNARLQGARHPAATDWAAIRDAIAASDPAAGVTAGDPEPARILSESLERDLASVFAEVYAAATRPHAAVVPSWLDGLRARNDNDTGFVWQQDIRKLAMVHYLRTLLDMELGNGARAVESCRVLLRLANGTEAHGTSIGQAVGRFVRALAHNAVWSLAIRRALPKQAWLDLAGDLHQERPLDRLPATLHLEMIFLHQSIEDLRADPQRLWEAWNLPCLPLERPRLQKRLAAGLIPRGWFDANEANLLEGYAEMSRLVQDATQPERFEMRSWLDRWIYPRGFPHHRLMASWELNSAGSRAREQAMSHALTRLAEAACGVEAFALDHRVYPESLDALVPAYLSALPLDLDGNPVRYVKVPNNGRYQLWSIGSNGTDEGGVRKIVRHSYSRSQPWGDMDGDWVDWIWQYPN